MLQLLDASLEAFLRATVPLPKKDVDVAFEAPDRDWGAGITKPTVDLYLWDVRRNLDEHEQGMTLSEEDGRRVRRRPDPRVDCRYLVTAWTSATRDEHALLGRVLSAVLRHRELPDEHLQGGYAEVRPLPRLVVGASDGRDQSDFWTALGGQLKPGLDLTVTATVDVAAVTEVGPPVETWDLTVLAKDPASRGTPAAAAAEGQSDAS